MVECHNVLHGTSWNRGTWNTVELSLQVFWGLGARSYLRSRYQRVADWHNVVAAFHRWRTAPKEGIEPDWLKHIQNNSTYTYWTEANYRSNYQNDLLLIDVSWAARIERRPFEIEKEGFDVFVVWPCFHRLQPNLISYTGTHGSRSCFLHLWFYGCFLGRRRGWDSIWVLSSASADHRSRGNSKRYLVAVDLSDSKLRCAEGKFFSFFALGENAWSHAWYGELSVCQWAGSLYKVLLSSALYTLYIW